MNIGLIGVGGVGRAFIQLLEMKKEDLGDLRIVFLLNSNSGIIDCDGIELNDVLEYLKENKDLSRYKGGFSKWNLDEVIKASNADCLVELTPTNKETGEPALSYIRCGMENGLHVVTGNKGPILIDYKGLKQLAKEKGISLGIGATTGGALPSITGGEYGLRGSRILGVRGVLNGTTNYILSLMEEEGLDYLEALSMAQREGIAEANPKMDVEGFDTAIKMLIISNTMLNQDITLDEVEIEGINGIGIGDIEEAKMVGKRIKLMGETYYDGDRLKIRVYPKLIDKDSIFYNVMGKNKGVEYVTDTLGEVAILGGASNVLGAAASVLRDILNIRRW